MRSRRGGRAAVLTAAVLAGGCGSGSASRSESTTASSSELPPALVAEARPIGRGPAFHPPATGPVLAPCRSSLGPRAAAHLEVFAENRVVLVASGIGTQPPQRLFSGRISRARCYGALVTLDPTGVILVRPGQRLTVGDLFRSWGQPVSASRLAGFRAPPGRRVAVFVDGHRWGAPPGAVPLTRHAEIVLEVGPHVPPHSSYTFPPGA